MDLIELGCEDLKLMICCRVEVVHMLQCIFCFLAEGEVSIV
jgi:hypothetical protein